MDLYYIYKKLPDHVAMCHSFCWAAHLDAALCVCRSLRNKLARVGNRAVVQQNPAPESAEAAPDGRGVFLGNLLLFISPIIFSHLWFSCDS